MKALRFPALTAAALLLGALPAVLPAAPPQQPGASAETPATPIPFSEIGARATADYQGDAIGIKATAEGARLRTGFQKLAGTVTAQGLRVESTAEGEGRLQLTAAALRRGAGPPMPLPARGSVTATAKTVTFTRPSVTEEYSVSVDGLRQDFLVTQRPAGTGDLSLELALTGAAAEAAAYGAKLTLEGSGRVLAYSRLHVTDAAGKELPATLEVPAPDRLAIRVEDAGAAYPLRIDPTFSDEDWVSLNPGIPGANNSLVRAAVVEGSGNLYIGGDFTFVGTVAASRIAKWDGSAWSALGSGMAGESFSSVHVLAVSGTDLYAGGSFTTAGGAAANYIAKWDGSAWSALGTGMDSTVTALAVNGTDIYAGGWFTTAGEVTVNRVAKWDGSAWSALGTGMDSTVRALAVSGTDLYAGGEFAMAGGVSASRSAKWNGNAWSALGTGMNGSVQALAVSGTDLYAGGDFTTAGAVSVNHIAKWDGNAWSALGTGVNISVVVSVYALAVSGTDLYAGGAFTTAGGVIVNHIAKWDGSAWSALGTGMDSTVRALAVSGTDLYAGGTFRMAGGLGAGRIAKWDGGAWSALGTGMNDRVAALAVSGTDLYAGGWFTTAGGVTVNRVAKWDGSAWTALGSGMGGVFDSVLALAVSGTDLYAGGAFTTAGGVAASRIAKWDGSAWSALGTGIDDSVHALVVSGTDLYAGGQFTTAGGVPANCVAKWDGSAWTALGTGVNAIVYALAVSGTDLYAGGAFSTAGGVAASRIAKWNGSAWAALGTGTNDIVLALAVSGTDLYAGGTFTTAGGVTVNRIAKWHGSAWSALGTGMDNWVNALAVIGTDLYAGGTFSTAGGVTARRVAKWDGSAWSAFGTGVNISTNALVADASDHLFLGGQFTLVGTATVSPYIAQANLNKAPAPTITRNTAAMAGNATTLIITGTNFDDTTPGNNTVAFTPAGSGAVTAATATSLTVTGITGLTAGALNAVVTTHDKSSGAPVQVATVAAKPDTKNPTLKLATPAGKAVSAPSPLTVAGVAGDGFAVDRVEVALNGGEVVLADLNHGSKPSAVPFSAQITPVIGKNTLVVTAYDPSGNSTSITRVFTFERRYVLTLAREVPAALDAMPDKAGTLALKAATAKNATALTKGSPQSSQVLPDTMLTLTAAAKTGHLFSHWTGLPDGAQVRGNVAVFMMPAEEVIVTAVFVANPLTQGAMAALGAKPLFQGLLRPDETTPPGNDTAGFLSAALTPAKGSLSGKLWMDGLVTAFTGALHGDGSVWFKAGKVMSSTLPFAGRELAMTWDESGLTMTVTRAINEVNHVSTGQAKPPLYSKTIPVRGALLDAKGRQGYFTLALPAVEQDPVKPAAEYPQGSGHAGVTLLANGTLKLAGTLAEGTKVTAASFLVEGDAAEVFVVLPTPGGKTKAGSLLGTLVFDEAQADVTSDDMQWFRPEAQTKAGVAQAYRAGWPGGIALGVLGALYDGSVPVQTTLGLDMTTTDGNAALIFQDGKLADEVSVNFNLEGSKVVKLDAKDKTWSLKLTPKTGLMSGTFTPNWPDAAKKSPAFSGVILQKGENASGRGFFLSNAAGDTEPESGAVELGAP